MANLKAVDVDKLDADLTSVANAIRTKGETSGSLAFPEGFVNAVNDIEATEVVEPVIEPLNVTENGVYNVPEGVDGYSPVNVDIDIPDPVIEPITITKNGVYQTEGDIDGYAPITVEVPIPAPVEPTIEALTITENGTYTAPEGIDGYSPITVEVEGEGGSLIDPSWTDFSYLFAYGRATDEVVSKLKFSDTSNGTLFQYMFQNGAITTVPPLDTSNGTGFARMFSSCSLLTTVPPLDTSNGTGFSYMFEKCKQLVTIEGLNLSKATAATSMFTNCTSLENITFTGTIGVTISFSNSSKLTIDSLKSIITALKDYAGTTNEGEYTLTLHATSKTNLETEGATAPNGLTWVAFAESKGWNIA